MIKVERPGSGDETRSWGPPHDADGMATYFQAVNRNKHSSRSTSADGDGAAARWTWPARPMSSSRTSVPA